MSVRSPNAPFIIEDISLAPSSHNQKTHRNSLMSKLRIIVSHSKPSSQDDKAWINDREEMIQRFRSR